MGSGRLFAALGAAAILALAGAPASADTITLACDRTAAVTRLGNAVDIAALPPNLKNFSTVIDTVAQTVDGRAVQNLSADANTITWQDPGNGFNTINRVTGTYHIQQTDGGYMDAVCRAGKPQF